MKDNAKKEKNAPRDRRPRRSDPPPPPADEDYFDDYWAEDEPLTEEEARERYYAERDAYYAERDAWYARRDAYYARRSAEEEEARENEPTTAPAGRPGSRRRRRRRRRGRIFRTLLTLALLSAVGALLVGTAPVRAGEPGGKRVPGRSNILLAGTDQGGMRTDTIMLLSLDRSSRVVRLLSIPRDTYAPDYQVPKINSAYGAAGGGEKGMEALMRQAEKVLGFAPDGYVLIDLECFVRAADLLGGLDFDVPMDMDYEDWTQGLVIDLPAGPRHLDGRELLGLVRFRSGYADADIGRTAVQRDVIRAALRQWVRPENVKALPELWKLFRDNAVSDLGSRNLLWIARVLLKADADAMETDVLPGSPAMIGGASCYVVDRDAAAALLKKYDPRDKG